MVEKVLVTNMSSRQSWYQRYVSTEKANLLYPSDAERTVSILKHIITFFENYERKYANRYLYR